MKVFTPNPKQDRFIRSPARHPCFAGSWATGKTLSAITRAEIYSNLIPDNLGCIFRKTAKSLNDSTLVDFQKYTGKTVNSERNYDYKNSSRIMFRHIDEIGDINQQNLNLGWFYIEQGEELESSNAFEMLLGRLRRDVKPTEAFLKFGLPVRSGWVICNAGDNWIRRLWKNGELESFKGAYPGLFAELVESTTEDNRQNLTQDYLDSLEVIKHTNPDLYKQYILNCWDVANTNRVFPSSFIEHCRGRFDVLSLGRAKTCIGVVVDPSGMGVDPNGFMAIDGGLPLEIYERTIMSATEKADKAIEMCKRVNGWWILVDCDGVGVETYKELIDKPDYVKMGIRIEAFNGSAPSTKTLFTGMDQERPMYLNIRAEAAFVAQARGYSGFAGIDPQDKILREDLEADVSIKGPRGLLQLVNKDEIRKIIKRSPTRGDLWKMAQWACEQDWPDETFRSPTEQFSGQGSGLQQYATG